MAQKSNLSKFALYALGELKKYALKREWMDSYTLADKINAKAEMDSVFAGKLELLLQFRVRNVTVFLRELCDEVFELEDAYFSSLKIGNAIDGLDAAYLCLSQRLDTGHQDVETDMLGARVNAKETLDIINEFGYLNTEMISETETRTRKLRLVNIAHGNKHIYMTICLTSATYWLSLRDMAPIGSPRFISADENEYKEDLKAFFDFILLRS